MLTRRSLIPVCAVAVALPAQAETRTFKIRIIPASTYKELLEHISAWPNKQMDGSSEAYPRPGLPYTEVSTRSMVRPGDELVGEQVVIQGMCRQIEALFVDKTDGVVHWRIRPEFEIYKSNVISEYREDGPDLDVLTDRRCVMDHNWSLVAAYARLAVDG